MNEYAKKYTKEYIERDTKRLLYYVEKMLDRVKTGETPVLYTGEIIKYTASLQTYYSRADDLEMWESLDFREIYQKALEEAKKELKLDD